MRKFSEINKVNEEFFLRKKKEEKGPLQFTKVSPKLMESYCKNLLSEEFMEVNQVEQENYSFKFYKIRSISKLSTRKFNVMLTTYDITKKVLDELSYNIEI